MNIEERRKRQALSRRRRVIKQRSEILDILGRICPCGFSDERALTIDHKFGGGSKERENIGGGYYSYVLKKLKNGSQEYQTLCSNCNQIKKVINDEERVRVH